MMPVVALLLAVVLLGSALAGVAGIAWGMPSTMRGWIAALQACYGTAHDGPFFLRADVHVHVVTALLVSLWFGLACRLFAPRGLPWLPVALALMVALSDEILQLGSSSRAFEWGDQLADAIGISASVPLLVLLARLPVVAGARTPPPASQRR